MATSLKIPSPAELSASYLVAAPARLPPGMDDRVREHAEEWAVPVALHLDRIGAGHADVVGVLDLLGCPDCQHEIDLAQLGRLRTADRHLLVTCTSPPSWPPAHLITARLAALEVAEETGGFVVDPINGRIDPPGWSMTLDSDQVCISLTDWIRVGITADVDGFMYMSTSGMGRLALPDLHVRQIPILKSKPWGDVVNGIAQALVTTCAAEIRAAPRARVIRVPRQLRVSVDDVARSYGCVGHTHGDGAAQVRLRLDERSSLLVVLPPDGYRGTPVQWRRTVVDEIYPPDRAAEEVRS